MKQAEHQSEPEWHLLKTEEAIAQLRVAPDSGLDSVEVERRRQQACSKCLIG